jgi:uncharacterized caspase-like protein
MSDSSLLRRLVSLLSALVAVIALVSSVAAAAETRVALIIANSHYAAFDKLTNPSSDASLIEAALKKVGFTDVMVREDLGRDAMNRVLQEFGNKADKADVALIYYAGHGVEVDHTNYLVPVDVVFAHERDVDIEAVRLDTALAVTENAKQLRMVIIDACRTDLVDRMGKSSAGVISKGLQTVDPTKGLLVWLSAKGNTPAYDGRANSPFAQSLARRITEQGREVSKLFNEVRDDVLQTTQNKQEPVPYGTSQDFFFVSPVAIAAVALPAPPLVPTIDIEKESWEICKGSLSTAPCESYLAGYPKGLYARLAHMKVADITTTAAANQASVATTVAAIRAQLAASMQAPAVAAAPVAVAANNPALAAPPVPSHAVAAPNAPVAVAANVNPASISGGDGSVGAARSTNFGLDAAPAAPRPASSGFAIVAPPSAPLSAPPSATLVAQASAPVVNAPIVNAPMVNAPIVNAPVVARASAPVAALPLSAPAIAPVPAPVAVAVAPARAPVVVAAAPAPAPVIVAAAPAPAPVAVATPASRPVQVAMLTAPAPTPAPAAVLVPAPIPAPVVVVAPPRPAPVVAIAPPPAIPTSARIGDLGITVRYDKVAKGIFVDSIDHNAPFVAGKLFLGDLIMKIGTAAPDAAQAPDTQLAAYWKSDGRLKLLVKRGDAVSVVMILGN